MILHLDSDNPKSIEQKVQELILKKLYIKVNDDYIFIGKEEFIQLILNDVIVIAKADYDMDEALKIALREQINYKDNSQGKKTELVNTLEEFATEIEAYKSYLNNVEEDMDDLDIYDDVLSILNSDYDLLIAKLQEIMIEALGRRLSKSEAEKMGVDRWGYLDSFANHIKLIATNDSLEDAVEEAYSEFEDYPDKHLVKKENIEKELQRISTLAENEIATYGIAMSMYFQNAEFATILATTKQMLQLQ